MRVVRRVLCVTALLAGGWLAGTLGYPGRALAAGGHSYYVAPNGLMVSCAANSATKPFKYIQDAVDCAAADGTTPTNRDTIHIAAGTYTETFDIEAHVTILGAGQTSTTIDGGGTGTVIDNGDGFTGYSVTINGLTITGGNEDDCGGGICNSGAMTLINTTVTWNQGVGGGGIQNTGTLTLSNSLVSHNIADDVGGGIDNNGGTVKLSNSPVTWNQATGNNAGSGGGGGIWNGGTMTLANSPISNNSALGGGGIENQVTMTLANSPVNNNHVQSSGGGIANAFAGGVTPTITMTNSDVSGNTVGDSGAGAGIFTYKGDLTITNAKISGNTGGSAADGGGIWHQSGLIKLKSVAITGNHVGHDGGGVYYNVGEDTTCSTITKTNVTISGNTPDNCSGLQV